MEGTLAVGVRSVGAKGFEGVEPPTAIVTTACKVRGEEKGGATRVAVDGVGCGGEPCFDCVPVWEEVREGGRGWEKVGEGGRRSERVGTGQRGWEKVE